MKKLRQTGTVQNYGLQFRNLVGQIENMGDLDQVAYFIEGLKPATKMEVSYKAPADLEEAWEIAIKYDTVMFGLEKPYAGNSSRQQPPPGKGNGSGNYKPTSSATPMELDQAETWKPKYNNRYNNNNKGKWVKREENCNSCGKPGHWARKYKSKSKAKVATIEKQPPIYNNSSTSGAELTYLEDNKE